MPQAHGWQPAASFLTMSNPGRSPAFSKPPQNYPTSQILQGLSDSLLVTHPASPWPFVAMSGSARFSSLTVDSPFFLMVHGEIREGGHFLPVVITSVSPLRKQSRHVLSDPSYTLGEPLQEILLPQGHGLCDNEHQAEMRGPHGRTRHVISSG